MVSTYFYLGNPQVEIIEGGVEYNELLFILDENKSESFSEGELELIKQFLWDINMKNDIIKSKDLICTNITNKFSILEFLDNIKIYISYIDIIRIFKSPIPNIYYIYLEFKNIEYSNIFFNTFNYSKINPLDKEYLLFYELQFIKYKEKFVNSNNNTLSMNFNIYNNSTSNTINQILEPKKKPKTNILEIETSVNYELTMLNEINSTSNSLYIPSNFNNNKEEPKLCPICLESMDSHKSHEITMSFHTQNNGIIYVLCGHSFHLDCILRLDDEKCPLCRFDLSPANVSTCSLCNASKDLWMCIICGSINCGELRDSSNHREQHYTSTGHLYARGINDYNVTFDFSRKLTLNSWFQNVLLTGSNNNIIENDIEVSSKTANYINEDENLINSTNHNQLIDFAKNPKEKVEFILSEYNSIISSQVESQRTYYINYINKIEETIYDELTKMDAEIKELQKRADIISKEKNSSDVEKKNFFDKIKQLTLEESLLDEKNKKKDQDFKDLLDKKKRNDHNIFELKNKQTLILKELDKEINRLEEEINECGSHINTKNEISKRKDASDIQGSSVRIINFDKKENKKKKK